MEIQHKEINNYAVVTLKGSLDTLTAPNTTKYLNDVISAGRVNIVADFSAVDYTSSAGLRVLLAAVKEARSRGGDLCLAGVRPDVHKVLTMSGFTSILKVFPDVNAAAANFA